VFAMLAVVLADSLLFLYLGWEAVGFCSYALIGFWYADARKAAAGRKAFAVTRTGDVAFGVALGFLFALGEPLSLTALNDHAATMAGWGPPLLGALFLWAAAGKSAQLPLSVWLPDAMAGPSPVSALIHSATMVTAGVYLLMRLFPVLAMSETVMLATAALGAATSLFAALSALAQRDIKRVLAYSTISQVGLMFMAVGVGDLSGGMFHLVTHAFFKSLLFLAAGCVIEALGGEHDIFRMGNMRRALPGVFAVFLAGTVSLSALPLTAGFFSKDHILLTAAVHPGAIWGAVFAVGFLTVLVTPLYAFRLLFIVFRDRPGASGAPIDRIERPTPSMMAPLWPLAALALLGGVLDLPRLWHGSAWLDRLLAPLQAPLPLPAIPHGFEWAFEATTAILSLGMVWAASVLSRPDGLAARGALPPAWSGLHGLLFSGFRLDDLYRRVIGGGYEAAAGFLLRRVEERWIDGAFLGLARGLSGLSRGALRATTGRLSTYLWALLWGCAILVFTVAAVLWAIEEGRLP